MSTKIENVVYRASYRDEISAEGECSRGWAELRMLRQHVLTIVLGGGGCFRVCDLTDSFYQAE
jgi:hypothetical protein